MGKTMGHGHVIPNPNGMLARCGGLSLCGVCQEEERLGRWLTDEEEKAIIAERQRPSPFKDGGLFNAARGILWQRFFCTFTGASIGRNEARLQPNRDGHYVIDGDLLVNAYGKGPSEFFRPGRRYVLEIREEAD